MAQAAPGASRLPDVAKVIAGDAVVLSWDDVLTAVSSEAGAPSDLYRQFYAANNSLLTEAFPSFAQPTSTSRSEFDKAVRPVETILSEGQQQELEQVTADALWLSKYVSVEEVESLRTALVEWQNRPELRLTAGLADAEVASLRDALGAESAQTLDLFPGGPHVRTDEEFDLDDARKSRLLQTFYRGQASMLALVLQVNIARSQNDGTSARWPSLLGPSADCTLKEAVLATTRLVETSLQGLTQPRDWKDISPDFSGQLETSFTTCNLQCVAARLQTLLLRTHLSKEIVTGEILEEWLRFLTGYDHFSQFSSDIPDQHVAVELIQYTSIYVTLALIKPASSLSLLDDQDFAEAQPDLTATRFFIDYDWIARIFELMSTAASSTNFCASPGVLAWALIFCKMRVLAASARHEREARQVQKAIDRPQGLDSQNRRLSGSSIGSVGDSFFESVLGQIPPMHGGEDTLESMLQSAVKGSSVFEVLSNLAFAAHNAPTLLASFQLQILQDLLAAARPALGYTSQLFNAQLAVLSPSSGTTNESAPFKPRVNFVGDSFLQESFLYAAASRFPYEALPFLRITKLLVEARNQSLVRTDGIHYIVQLLQKMESFTQSAVGGFAAYHTYHEDENANLVTLEQPVSIFDLRPTRLLAQINQEVQFQAIPCGAEGEVMSESVPPVIRWKHNYSGLSLLGKWLDLHVRGELTSVVSSFETANDVASAAIGLLSSLLDTTYSFNVDREGQGPTRQLCEEILEHASLLLDSGRDVVDCIFDMIEQQLVSTRRFSPSSGCDLLATSVDFLTILCKVRPTRLWPSLVKSSVLAGHGAKRSVFAVIASVEVPIHNFTLLESCSKFLQALIDLVLVVSTQADIVRGLKTRSTPAQRPLATALLGLTENMYTAFEAMASWNFTQHEQKQAITCILCDAFNDILYRSFGLGPSHDADSNVTVCYRPAANFLLSALSGSGVQSLGSGPIAMNLVSNVLGKLTSTLSQRVSSNIRSLLRLARTHLGCSRISGHALEEVNTTLINLLPVFVRLPILYADLLRPCLALNCDILDTFESGSTPPLLGHLGTFSCLSFLDSLRSLNARAYEESPMPWRLISRLISLDQQWTAVVLITGSPPGRGQKQVGSHVLRTRGKPFLEQALDKVSNIQSTDPTVVVALLKLLTEAQQSWPSVADAITTRQDLFTKLINHVSARTSYHSSDTAQALHNQVAAGVIDLSIISLHSMMAFRDETKFLVFVPLLEWLRSNALQVAAYNVSMHANLKKNFAMKYSGLDVHVVKRTGILHVPYGAEYFYDLDFASRILGDDQHWNGGPQSFHAEFERANINLSVVESEMVLLRSFKHLCSEHAMFFAKHQGVRVVMCQVASVCLPANPSPRPAEALFDTLALSRIEIAALVLGPLVTVDAEGPDFSALLRSAYSTSLQRNGSYELALANNDLTYWRAMLNVVRLSMQFHTRRSQRSMGKEQQFEGISPFNTLFCEIAAHVVGEGLQSVIAALQDQEQRSAEKQANSELIDAADVSLLLNIFQTMLRVPSLPQFAAQLADALISTGTPQTLLLFFSWSHLLDQTPIYGVLAARFLASISRLGPIAEELAIEGVFSRLLLAKTTQKIQKMPHGVGHLDQRPSAPMLYKIWNAGLLRIALNLLDAIGGGVAAEAAGFLNQFPQQLARASMSLSTSPNRTVGSEGLTLDAACELTNLSLLSFVLDRFRLAGASSAVDSTQITRLFEFDEHKKALLADIKDVLDQDVPFRLKREVPTDDTEAVWARTKVSQKHGDTSVATLLDRMIIKELYDARKCLLSDGEE